MAVKIRAAGKEYKLSDVGPYFLYDKETITTSDTGTVSKVYFQSPEGKSELDTNLQQFSTIPLGWVFEVSELRIIPEPDVEYSDLQKIFKKAIVIYKKQGVQDVFLCPAILFNAGCGVMGGISTTESSATYAIHSLGLPSAGAAFRFPMRYLIRGGETFNFEFRCYLSSAISASIGIWMVLVGILKKPVTSS